jgi:hypothetical protein
VLPYSGRRSRGFADTCSPKFWRVNLAHWSRLLEKSAAFLPNSRWRSAAPVRLEGLRPHPVPFRNFGETRRSFSFFPCGKGNIQTQIWPVASWRGNEKNRLFGAECSAVQEVSRTIEFYARPAFFARRFASVPTIYTFYIQEVRRVFGEPSSRYSVMGKGAKSAERTIKGAPIQAPKATLSNMLAFCD